MNRNMMCCCCCCMCMTMASFHAWISRENKGKRLTLNGDLIAEHDRRREKPEIRKADAHEKQRVRFFLI